MAKMDMDLPGPPTAPVVPTWKGSWKGRPVLGTSKNPHLLPYDQELNLTGSCCPVCFEAFQPRPSNVPITRGDCENCRLWSAKCSDFPTKHEQRFGLVVITWVQYGDSKRKQNARIRKATAALEEARRLQTEPESSGIRHFGEVSADDYVTIFVMADWLMDNDYPLNAAACRLIAETRKFAAGTVLPTPAPLFPSAHKDAE